MKPQTKQTKICARCITPEIYPGIKLDKNGICSHCHTYEKRFKDWKDKKTTFSSQLREKRQSHSKYTAIVGISGGKDSSYLLHVLVKIHGMKNILAATNDNGFLADNAKKNIDRMIDKLGIDHIYYGPDPDLTKRLYQALIKKKCSDWCLFCMAGSISGLIDLAIKKNIKNIVMGISPKTEPIFPFEMINAFDFKYLKDVVQPYVKASELRPFRHITLLRAAYATFIRRIRFINLPEYIDWDNEKIVNILTKEYGWIDYGRGKPHFDCLLNPAVDYFMKQRLGVNKVVENLSVLVRAGHLTREAALKRLSEQDSDEKPTQSLEQICKKITVTLDDLKPYIDGTALNYRYFKSNVQILRKLSWVFWISCKLGFTTRILYEKYSK